MKIKKLSNLLKGNKSGLNRKIEPYDTQAEVKRIENGIAWVHIAGGVDETPVNLTINAKVGDTVQVRVGGGRAWLTGNKTAPPTDDTKANAAQGTANNARQIAESAVVSAEIAADAADRANVSAGQAKASANRAEVSANEAKTSATEANNQAISATNSANNALGQLGVVESVVDTLTWIAEHSVFELTTDTSVVASKTYYVPNNQTLTMTDGTYQISGLTIFIKDGIVTVNGTATADVYFELGTPSVTAGENIYISGASGGSSQTYGLRYYQAGGSVFVFDGIKKTTAVSGAKYYVYVENGYTATDLIFYPRVSNSNDGYEYVIVDSPTGNPTTQGYYELDTDDAVKTYVQTHLALMNDGLYVVKDNSGYKVKIDNLGMYIENPSGEEVAEFSSTEARIGKKSDETAFLELNTEAITAYNSEGVNVLDISFSGSTTSALKTVPIDYDYNSGSSSHTITELSALSNGTQFSLQAGSSLLNVISSFTYGTASSVTALSDVWTYDGLNTISSTGNTTRTLTSLRYFATLHAPVWTFGERVDGSSKGIYSFSQGKNNTASGAYSNAHGIGLIAKGSAQTAIGKYNVGDTTTNAFIIGNGSSLSSPSNAFAVDWDGNVNIASGAKYKINGTALAASDVGAVPTSDVSTSGGASKVMKTDSSGDLTVGLLKATKNSNTVTIGSQNSSWCHIYNSANVPFIFNKGICTTSGDLGTSSYKWGNLYMSGTANIGGDVDIGSGKHYKINGTNLSASDVGAFPKSNMTRGISMVSTIPSDGKLTLNNTDIGGSSSAKIQGVLAIPQYSNGVTVKHNYDASSTSQVVLNFYKADGSAYSGAMRYFLITFPDTWTP